MPGCEAILLQCSNPSTARAHMASNLRMYHTARGEAVPPEILRQEMVQMCPHCPPAGPECIGPYVARSETLKRHAKECPNKPSTTPVANKPSTTPVATHVQSPARLLARALTQPAQSTALLAQSATPAQAAAPTRTSLNTNTFKAALEAWAADKPLIDHTEEHLDRIFHEVFSSSLLNVSNSCRIDAGTTIGLVFELVAADRGYEPAWKLPFALPRMLVSPVQHDKLRRAATTPWPTWSAADRQAPSSAEGRLQATRCTSH